MHAGLDELLNLRDGEPVSDTVRAHVGHCARCTAAIAHTRVLRERLRALPAVPAAATDGWLAVEEQLAATTARRRRAAAFGSLAAAASVAALALFAALRWHEAPVPPSSASSEAPAPVAVDELRSRSQALEAVLAALPARPAVARAGTAVPIESLEAQVQWLDHQILLADAGEPSPATVRLWNDRVEVMSSLVQLRYVEAQTLFP